MNQLDVRRDGELRPKAVMQSFVDLDRDKMRATTCQLPGEDAPPRTDLDCQVLGGYVGLGVAVPRRWP